MNIIYLQDMRYSDFQRNKIASTTNYKLPQNRLDFVRFLLASLVVFSHSFPLASGTEKNEPLFLLTGGQLTLGAVAVDCFFIISGFLILHSWLAAPDINRFLAKRIRRIYPAFIVAACFGSLFLVPLTSHEGFSVLSVEFLVKFFANLPRLQALEPAMAFPQNPAPGPVNGSLWSIPFEFWCYVGVLGLGLSSLASRRRLIAASFIATIFISFVFVRFNLTPGGKILGVIFGYPPFWARLLPFFLAGMAMRLYVLDIIFTWKLAMLSAAALIFSTKITYALIFVLPLACSYIIFWFCFMPGKFLTTFGKFGDFSYGIYLYSFPILQIVSFLAGKPITPWQLFWVSWPLAIVCGWMSWHLLEKHFVTGSGGSSAQLPMKAGPAT